MQSPTVRLGVVGLGNMGAKHARSILLGKIPGATLAAVCDAREAPLGEFTARGRASPAFTTPDALITSGSVDAVPSATLASRLKVYDTVAPADGQRGLLV